MSVFGLTETQHDFLGSLHAQSGDVVRREPITKPVEGYLPPVRVIALSDRVYDSTTSEELPVFVYDSSKLVYNVEQIGSALAGYLVLIINGTRYVVECRRENLNDIRIPGLRITVFPGLWELDFGVRTTQQVSLISVEIVRLSDDEELSLCELFDDLTTPIYTGSTIVRQEYWVSVPEARDAGIPVVHRAVTDCLPYNTAGVAKGAIGSAMWNWDAGYTAIAWQCRNFSHATDYVQADDPVPL